MPCVVPAGANGWGAAPSFSADRLFSRTMVDAGLLARQSERMLQTIAVAAERIGYDHGLRLHGQLRQWGHVGDRVCAYAFGSGILPADAHDYTIEALRRALRTIEPLVAPLPGRIGTRTPIAADNAFMLVERAWVDLLAQALDLQRDVVGVWLDLTGHAVGGLSSLGASAAISCEPGGASVA